MKKFLLRFLAAGLVLTSFTILFSCSDKDEGVETIITEADLPSAAQAFLKKYFNGYEIIKVEKDVEGEMTLFEVELQDGYELVFNSAGEWTQVEAPYGKTIPTGFIPEQVLSTLNNRFQGYGINEINTTGEGYKVELSDNQGGASLDVFFDMSGEIIGINELD